MNFNVSLTEGAGDDIREILRWIEDRSRSGAISWFDAWLRLLESIRARADHFGYAPESDGHSEPIRHALFKTRRGLTYRALFVIRDMNVFVLHVRGPGQDLLRSHEIRLPN